jgi:hypothetical protein
MRNKKNRNFFKGLEVRRAHKMSEMKMGISEGKYKMKNIKNIGMSAVIIGTLVLLSGCTQTEIEITEKETETQQTGPVYVGCGWSTNNDAVEAVAEAVSLVQNKLGEKSADYIILFSTVGYDSEVVLGEVNKLFPNTQIYGGTSCAAVITKLLQFFNLNTFSSVLCNHS